MCTLFAREDVWNTVDDDNDFALDVDVGIVVMVAIARRDAIADEDQRGGDFRFQNAGIGADQDTLALGECLAINRQLAVFQIGCDFLQRNFREIGAVLAGGLEAEEAILGCNIVRSDLKSVGTGVAATHVIRRQEADMRFDVFDADIRGEFCGGCVATARRHAVHITRHKSGARQQRY